jgi:hypothetical protein
VLARIRCATQSFKCGVRVQFEVSVSYPLLLLPSEHFATLRRRELLRSSSLLQACTFRQTSSILLWALPIYRKSNHGVYVSVGTERAFIGAAITRAEAALSVRGCFF